MPKHLIPASISMNNMHRDKQVIGGREDKIVYCLG